MISPPQTAAETGTAPHGAYHEMPFQALIPAETNPRTSAVTPDDPALAGLAASIKANGLLEPLIVRAGSNVIIAGHRRHRAVGLLIEAGDWPKERKLPVMVREVTDGEAIALALIENVQREDIRPMEEGRAFAALVTDHKWDTARIKQTIGKSRRHVQLRLALVEKLAPVAQQALDSGDINFAAARVLTLVPVSEHKEAVKKIKTGGWGWDTADQIRDRLFGDKPPVTLAGFALDKYTGAICGEDDDRRFADVAQFQRLQTEAAVAKAEAIKGDHDFVESFDEPDKRQYFYQHNYDRARGRARGGAVVVLTTDYEIEVVPRLLHKETAKPAAAASGTGKDTPKKTAPPFTNTHLIKVNNEKTRALQHEVAADPVLAKRLAIFALLGGTTVELGFEHTGTDDPDPSESAGRLAQTGNFGLPAWIGKEHWLRNDTDDAIEKAVAALPAAKLDAVLATLVAGAIGKWNGYDPQLGDDEFTLKLAALTKPDVLKSGFKITEDYLATLSKPRLIEMVEAVGLAGGEHLAVSLKSLGTWTAKILREKLLEVAKAGGFDGFIPRELRFGTEAQLARPLPAGAPAGSTTTTKAKANTKAKTKTREKKTDAKKTRRTTAKTAAKAVAAKAKPRKVAGPARGKTTRGRTAKTASRPGGVARAAACPALTPRPSPGVRRATTAPGCPAGAPAPMSSPSSTARSRASWCGTTNIDSSTARSEPGPKRHGARR